MFARVMRVLRNGFTVGVISWEASKKLPTERRRRGEREVGGDTENHRVAYSLYDTLSLAVVSDYVTQGPRVRFITHNQGLRTSPSPHCG